MEADADTLARAIWKAVIRRVKTRRAQQLKDLHDLAVIPVLEAVFAKAAPAAGLAVIAALAAMPQQAATDSLVRHAVFCQARRSSRSGGQGARTS